MSALGLDPAEFVEVDDGGGDGATVGESAPGGVEATPVLAVVGRPNVGKATLVNRLLGRREAVVEDTRVLAVVGGPNVAKSPLVNRLLGRREAVVEDIPGVTRDRIAYDGLWNGRRFTLVDTGGWEPDATGLQGAVAAQAEMAM